MTQLIVCCDGTWNTLEHTDQGLPAPTNVAKVYNAAVKDGQQLAYYHPGVGTNGGWLDRMVGGGTGAGLERNIMSAYQWLATHYHDGDRIFLFGFSRGAYTVRSLGGLLAHSGLLDLSDATLVPAETWSRVEAVFEAYRSGQPFANAKGYAFHGVAPGKPTAGTISVHFMGVWDTVGALGIPLELSVLRFIGDPHRYQFHDTKISPMIAHARHAVAMDERRADFMPTLWTNIRRPERVHQVWFPGVHGDVGGGYAQAGLSDIALEWMLDEAATCGLRLREGTRAQLRPDPQGVLHDSRQGLFKLGRNQPRAVPCVADTSARAGLLHPAALARQADPPLAQGDYWPTRTLAQGEHAMVDVFASPHWNATGLYLEAGTRYRFAASGEWLDAGAKFSAAGGEVDGHHVSDIARLAASAFGSVEHLFNTVTDSQNDFWFTRRVESAPWCALIGFVADNQGEARGETFLIGEGASFTPATGGYLYAYANDAWQAYANNHGSVAMVVERV
ncbi:DUF2235 domain-containing protein [Frateuria sp. STR12]|uniref:DUF2235 domain-containing protein n=1 Tax=Frateuria hangzhouensis TaxID=2995589 RepID=UPI0022609469|nr:DUF2235 domain-containing protein [Frateuria sp. STR12]MCX7513399.1 DUF2235 domain-containing protein [Frateuria sp. STR12]